MSERSVLYDEPGPRTHRITLIASVVAAILVLVGLYYVVYRPLEAHDQFTARKWDPLINPSDKNFPLVWKRIGQGLRATVTAAVFAIIASLLFGAALAVARLQLQSVRRLHHVNQSPPVALLLRVITVVLNLVTRVFVEIFRGLPVLITIFFVARALPELVGVGFDTLWYLVIGLALYNSVVIAEILRSGMSGLPGGQREAATSLGLSSFLTIRLIQLPQAVRIMLPALISQIVVIFKDTSLGTLIAYEDLLAVGFQVFNFLNNPIQVLTVIAVLFIGFNYALSKLAAYLQRRIARGRRRPPWPLARPPARPHEWSFRSPWVRRDATAGGDCGGAPAAVIPVLVTPKERLAQLCVAEAEGQPIDILAFWGHRPNPDGSVGRGCLSQWWPQPFTVDGVRYPSAEHWMMAGKARLFEDAAGLAAVLAASSPGAAKAAGRTVHGFHEARWRAARYELVVGGNMAKFGQNPDLGDFLRGTGRTVLVEASPHDRIWGIGLADTHEDVGRPTRWRGLNLLGFALMDVRERL